MNDRARREMLAIECRVFTRYLAGADLSLMVEEAYIRGHQVSAVEQTEGSHAFEQTLLRIARTSPGLAQAADGYAVVFAKASQLRRKLVLLVAILESRQQTAQAIEPPSSGSLPRRIVSVAVRVVAGLARTAFVTLLVPPLWAWYRLTDRRHS